ncbi:DUF5686 and carboxypeptidase regulatory-like domain-containing protein [Carboxylicivirga marina]|uniref:Carboxypeptidase-like regulatory domain-containing protein n=2 Tax=Carboxylicivirga marina TaxID=2800988 RepID=A0ABS1HM08_9BACT|nr:DUF5686 and carboxypeptidase regulatory-like domain-containing protein [Carboxylicivirga marina]MBK3518293.1 carboxypeptidase-like regulatory domain-containing protein [Carboxylicivirga marina]
MDKLYLAGILLLLPILGFSQGVKGTVTDEQGNPIPFATIFLKETTTGTTTNDLGEYEIHLQNGTYTIVFQGLGFQKTEVTVNVNDEFITNNIVLKKQEYRIKEVRVFSGGEDPAYPIMRKAISLAPYYQRQTEQYKAEVYLKGSLLMKKIPKLFQKMMERDEESPDIKVGETYTMESMNEIEFTAPDKYNHTVLSSRSTFPDSNDEDVMGYITYSFYEPHQDMAISPLAPNSFSHYKFVYEGFFYEGDVAVNKIKIVPKRKSQQTYTGYIYIVDNLWNIHSIDVTNEAFFGEINIKQVYAPVKERSWLPISHRFNVAASIFGVKADFWYAGSVKYSDIQLNTNLPVPNVLMKQYAAEEAAQKAAELQAEKEQEMTRQQKKMEELLAKEELSNREMIKLSRLIEKESRKEEEKKEESLEIKSTYKITHKKDTTKRDSSYWETIRPIPLTSGELRSFEVKDSIKLAKIESDTIKTEKKKRSAFSKVSDGFLSGHTFYANDSSTRITYHGLIGLSQVDFNAVDGWSYQQRLTLRHEFDSVHTFRFEPMIEYAFAREKVMWDANAWLSFAPKSRANLSISGGQQSKDFNSKYGIDRTLNMFSALFFKDHYMKLYQKDYAAINGSFDLIHGMRIRLAASYSSYQQLENNTNWSILDQDKDYTENTPPNEQVTPEHLMDQSDMFTSLEVSYTPRMRYRMYKGRKYLRGSRYPTFKVNYQRGFNNVFDSDSDYELIRGEISQKKEWGIFNAFNWQVGAGYFSRNDQMHFSRFQHFNTSEIPVNFKSWENAFMLLDDYRYSTNEWYAKAHVSYTTPYLLLKFLPLVSNRLWTENLYSSYLTQPNYKNYVEVGYSMNQIFLIGSAGVFAGFEDGSYARWGFRLGININ